MKIITVITTAAVASTLATVAVLSLAREPEAKLRLDSVSTEEEATTTTNAVVTEEVIVIEAAPATTMPAPAPIEERVDNLETRVSAVESVIVPPSVIANPPVESIPVQEAATSTTTTSTTERPAPTTTVPPPTRAPSEDG